MTKPLSPPARTHELAQKGRFAPKVGVLLFPHNSELRPTAQNNVGIAFCALFFLNEVNLNSSPRAATPEHAMPFSGCCEARHLHPIPESVVSVLLLEPTHTHSQLAASYPT